MTDFSKIRGGAPVDVLVLVNTDNDTILGNGSQKFPIRVNTDSAPFVAQTVVVHASPLGSDETGDGSAENPYATFQYAVTKVPTVVPAGTIYVIDITGITETLPDNYTLPPWKSAFVYDAGDTTWKVKAAVNIQATPELVPLSPPTDATVAAADIASTTVDPITKLIKVTIGAARASWGSNALKGKQILTGNANDNCVIYESDTTHLYLTTTTVPPTPFTIVQPSATLSADLDNSEAVIQAYNCDSIAFNGIRIIGDSDSGVPGLSVGGNSMCIAQLCELGTPQIVTVNSEYTRLVRSWVYGSPFLASSGLYLNSCFMDTCTDAAFVASPASTSLDISACVFDGCDPIEATLELNTESPLALGVFAISNTLIRNGDGDGVIFHGSYGFITACDIYACAGNGVTCAQGSGFLNLGVGTGIVGSSGAANANYGIQVSDGIKVNVNAATIGASSPLNGTSAQIAVGALAPTDWATFGDGSNLYDITAVDPVAGATGSGSRLYG